MKRAARRRGGVLVITLGLATGLTVGVWAEEPDQTVSAGGSCQACHLQLDEPELRDPAVAFGVDIHNRPGLGCVGCHGGDATAEDPEAAMDPKKGFRGVPTTNDIPEFCGGFHADGPFIKRF